MKIKNDKKHDNVTRIQSLSQTDYLYYWKQISNKPITYFFDIVTYISNLCYMDSNFFILSISTDWDLKNLSFYKKHLC